MEERIVDLEVKFSFLERQIEELDELVRELSGEVTVVRRQFEAFRRRLDAGPDDAEANDV